jgi:hypothetical protein
MSKRDESKSLYESLSSLGLFEYGSDIPREAVHEILQIEMPAQATKEEFDQLALIELSAIDYCRNILLGHGKYLAGTRSGYRVLLPSENKAQIDSYILSADKKLNRALKLSRSSPAGTIEPSQLEARVHFKQNRRVF